ncbi:MAG: hypothetical protein JNM25_12895 [Planctomycetes bacterium]|nr:hypothetical protein [Planctomycetota bacterium]
MNLPLPKTQLLGLVALAIAAASAHAQSILPVTGQVVAAVGDAPTGTPAGVTIGGTTSPLDGPVMDRDGNILFRGLLTGTGISSLNNRALFYGRASGDLRMLVQGGVSLDPSGTYPNTIISQTLGSTGVPNGPGLPSAYRASGGFVLFGSQLYDASGLDGIIATGTTANNTAIYWGQPGSLQILAQKLVTTMPGGAQLNSALNSPSAQATALNESGTAIFYSVLTGGDVTTSPPNEAAWIMGTPNNLSYLIRKADPVPGTGGNFVGTIGNNCILNGAGQVFHDETLSTTLGPATTANDKVLLITTAGVHDLLAREGDLAPGCGGATYNSMTPANSLSPTGKTAFHSSLLGATTIDDGAIFAGGVGTVALLARENDAAPGTGGALFNIFFTSSITYSDNGGVVFTGTLQTGTGTPVVGATNDSGIWAGQPGNVQLVLREGDAAPGIAGGVIGRTTSYNFAAGDAMGNELGQILIKCRVVIGGTTDTEAFYSYDPVHGLRLQLQQGDNLGSNPNTQGVLGNFLMPASSPSNDSSPLGFTNHGDFVIKPAFTGTQLQGIVRGHVGSMIAEPSSVPVAGGVPQNFHIDCGPTQAGQLYLVLATGLGTRPGFVSPFGGQAVPLNPDPIWTDLSLNNPNSIVWPGTLGFLDANGKNITPASFVMPPGFPVFLGTTLHHAVIAFDINFGLQTTYASEPSGVLLY